MSALLGKMGIPHTVAVRARRIKANEAGFQRVPAHGKEACSLGEQHLLLRNITIRHGFLGNLVDLPTHVIPKMGCVLTTTCDCQGLCPLGTRAGSCTKHSFLREGFTEAQRGAFAQPRQGQDWWSGGLILRLVFISHLKILKLWQRRKRCQDVSHVKPSLGVCAVLK